MHCGQQPTGRWPSQGFHDQVGTSSVPAVWKGEDRAKGTNLPNVIIETMCGVAYIDQSNACVRVHLCSLESKHTLFIVEMSPINHPCQGRSAVWESPVELHLQLQLANVV